MQLFYKAHQPRAKDESDFAAAFPLLSAAEQAWLDYAITDTYGQASTRLGKLL